MASQWQQKELMREQSRAQCLKLLKLLCICWQTAARHSYALYSPTTVKLCAHLSNDSKELCSSASWLSCQGYQALYEYLLAQSD